MAEECNESSIATFSATPNWWPDLHASSLSSWTSSNTNNSNTNNITNSCIWQTTQNPNNSTNSSGEEESLSISTSFTNASNHSGLSVDHSASASELIGETASDNHLWSHVLLGVGSNRELNNSQEVGENSTGMFDYMKKRDNSCWEFTVPPSFNNFERQVNGFNESLIENQRLTKLVTNWSIAPPEPETSHQFDPQACKISLSTSTIERISESDLNCYMRQTESNLMPYGSFSCYGQEMKVNRGIEAREALFGQSFNTNGSEYQMGLLNNSIIVGDNNSKFYYGTPEVACASSTSVADAIPFNTFLSKPSVDMYASNSKPVLRSLNLSDCKKLGSQASSQTKSTRSTHQTATRSSVRGQGVTINGKKKMSEDNSEAVLKKHKIESSTVSSAKVQVPKVKLSEKITALQQIVSPFGKTDTASVLWEAIGYIKFLQEQVQLLSNPYMKTNACKDPWGVLDRKDRGDVKLDLQSRGLCLVPISCTPQTYRENTGSDYWTPTYRGCLYR